MTITQAVGSSAGQSGEPPAPEIPAVEGPVWVGWREGTLMRAAELEALCEWVGRESTQPNNDVLTIATRNHLTAAKAAARCDRLVPHRRLRMIRNGALIERAQSNLDAAEAFILAVAPADYVLGQMPSLLKHVQRHLTPNDPRRRAFEHIARKLGIKDADHPLLQSEQECTLDQKRAVIFYERRAITTIVRGASSEALREHVRLRSFRNIVVATAAILLLLAVLIAIIGWLDKTLIPICFAPEQGNGVVMVVCPTAESVGFVPMNEPPQTGIPRRDIDDEIAATASPADLLVIELVGLTAAAIAAAAAIRRIEGSERYGLPVALAALKLPTGAITAFLGLLLVRGQFVPGLSALDTPAQILAWALLFGYAQELFTRLVDQQGQTVLNRVRGADKPAAASTAV